MFLDLISSPIKYNKMGVVFVIYIGQWYDNFIEVTTENYFGNKSRFLLTAFKKYQTQIKNNKSK